MVKILAIIAAFILSFHIGFSQEPVIHVPQKSPKEKTETQVGLIDISISYSRPSTRGRMIFGELVPFNKIWRTGANINTAISFSGAVMIGDQELEAGTYTLFTEPGPDEWSILFHKEHHDYGVPDTIHSENVLARINVPSSTQNRKIETMSLSLEDITNNSCKLVIAWDQTVVSVPITVSTSSIMTDILDAHLERVIDAYSSAAYNYLETEKDPESALKAIDFALTLRESQTPFSDWLKNVDSEDWSAPWLYKLKSEIHAALDQYQEAISAAERSLEVCAIATSADITTKENKENIEKWKGLKASKR